jgi:hypothetical protein
MGKIVATQYISPDGVIEDTVGIENSGLGNWTGPSARGSSGDRPATDREPAAGERHRAAGIRAHGGGG